MAPPTGTTLEGQPPARCLTDVLLQIKSSSESLTGLTGLTGEESKKSPDPSRLAAADTATLK